MEKFNIEVLTGDHSTINISMEPGENVYDVAQKLSVAYDTVVIVSMHSRSRWIFEKGELNISHPDLSLFYTDVDSQTAWEWSCFGQCTA